jgi:hypothetical protein
MGNTASNPFNEIACCSSRAESTHVRKKEIKQAHICERENMYRTKNPQPRQIKTLVGPKTIAPTLKANLSERRRATSADISSSSLAGPNSDHGLIITGDDQDGNFNMSSSQATTIPGPSSPIDRGSNHQEIRKHSPWVEQYLADRRMTAILNYRNSQREQDLQQTTVNDSGGT